MADGELVSDEFKLWSRLADEFSARRTPTS